MYLPDSARGSEWSASPNLAPDEVLSRSPKTWVAVADQDLLSPEALAFAEQLRDLQVEVEVKRYPGMPHNILAMNGESALSNRCSLDLLPWLILEVGILSKGAQLVNDAGRVLRTAFEQLAPTP
jgi:acetyl esterase/lipase